MKRNTNAQTKKFIRAAYVEVSCRTFIESAEKVKEYAAANNETINHLINRLLQAEVKRLTGKEIQIPDNNNFMIEYAKGEKNDES